MESKAKYEKTKRFLRACEDCQNKDKKCSECYEFSEFVDRWRRFGDPIELDQLRQEIKEKFYPKRKF
jgi:hypothetical protein